jgi:ribonuclease Z
MVYRVHPFLVNGRFGDPVVYIDFRYERRGILCDIGDLTGLSHNKIRQVTDICISHAHMDHLAGFDGFLRLRLTQASEIRVFGPPGIIERIGHHLAGYSWNLAAEHSADLSFRVTEMVSNTEAHSAIYRLRDRFVKGGTTTRKVDGGILHEDRDIRVCGVLLDHKLPVVAYSIEERRSLNILKTELEKMELGTGPWLDGFKHALLSEAPGETPIAVVTRSGADETRPLRDLKNRIVKITPGHKIAFVVDVRNSPGNEARIVALAKGADILFIEAAFAEADTALATARAHLTTVDAGRIGVKAGVQRIEPCHFSLRYAPDEANLTDEVLAAFTSHRKKLGELAG